MDNPKTFKAVATWIRSIKKSELIHDYLENHITWQFKLSRVPWLGSHFGQMVGLMKQCLYKTFGKATLSWQELEEVLLDIEITWNNRLLNYLEDDIKFPVLTPNTLAFGEETFSLEEHINITEGDLQKKAKHVNKVQG